MAGVLDQLDRVGCLRLVEARPATARLVLRRRIEQLGTARRAVVRAVGVLVDVLATPGVVRYPPGAAPRTAPAISASRQSSSVRSISGMARQYRTRVSRAGPLPRHLVATAVVVGLDLQRGVGDAVPLGEQRAGLSSTACESVPTATIRWAVATSISDVSVHTCTSCTSTTPVMPELVVQLRDVETVRRRLHEHAAGPRDRAPMLAAG